LIKWLKQKRASTLKDSVIIYSHPRSGLHLLSLGIYLMGEHFNKEHTYAEVWGNDHMPSHRHWFQDLEPAEVDLQFKKHILLLRDFGDLAATQNAETVAGLNVPGYTQQICRFEQLKSPKMVVYYEDLISDNNTFIKVADFLDIKYDLKKIDFEHLKKYAHDLYLDSGHKPSVKQEASAPRKLCNRNNIRFKLKNQQEHDLFDKYLRRYDNG